MSKSTNIFIPAATVIDPTSKWHEKKVSVVIENGKITSIGKKVTAGKNCKKIEHKNIHISPGWLDMQANICEPGFEYKEDINSALKAAAFGGFTAIMPTANTYPIVDSKSGIQYVINQAASNIVDVYPTGALSKKMEGKEMSEMADMKSVGAIAFSDYKNSIQNPALLLKALLYSKASGGLIMHFPTETNLSANGQINEGKMSIKLGLKSIPELAEELIVQRDIRLTAYSEHKMHFSQISLPSSIQQLKQAKKSGIQVSSGVSSYHLMLNEEMLEEFDTNYKVSPPLRTKQDINALIKGLKDNVIDVIISDHSPENIENKNLEFDHAEFGIVNLETSFAVANSALRKHLSTTAIIEKVAINPRKLLGLKVPTIEKGANANITLFDPDLKWTYTDKQRQSKSANSPFFEKELVGKALAICNKGQFYEA